MAREFANALQEVDDDPLVRALVVHGSGNSFCSGADLSLLSRSGGDPLSDEARAEVSVVYEAFVRLGQLKVPSIAAVHGAAVGAGLNLALAATIRVVGESARLISGFHRIGLHPGGGHLHLLTIASGPGVSAAMSLFDQELDGAGAVAKGLAWEVVPDERLLERCLNLAKSVTIDRELVQMTLTSLRLSASPPLIPWSAALEIERGAQQWSLSRFSRGRDAQPPAK